ncbi:MAG: 30S ribosomal protein S6e [Methanocalculaceae archaeon]|jgi:small subunit ribosomal protein S6e|nr:30S ribosomal protein S6e [Methanocalculaceae archaeon]
MVDFKVVLSDPKTGLSYKIAATGAAAGALLGKKIGTEVDGSPFGLNGYKIIITGGSDKAGTPARPDLPGNGRRNLLLSDGFGFHAKHNGQRERKGQRGNEIAADFVQVNAKISIYGEKPITEIMAPAEVAASVE